VFSESNGNLPECSEESHERHRVLTAVRKQSVPDAIAFGLIQPATHQ